MPPSKRVPQLESNIRYLNSVVTMLSCPSPIKGFLPVPIPEPQRPAIDEWLKNNFSSTHHGEGHFDGVKFCVFQPIGWREDDFPVPMPSPETHLMVQFSCPENDNSYAHKAWWAIPYDARKSMY
jgi:hypothetical protein